nr:hypothetical protein [Haladaptatus sp. R4]
MVVDTVDIDAPRAITNLLELVPIVPEIHEDVILAAATYIDEYHMTPFNALYAGLVATKGEQALSTN